LRIVIFFIFLPLVITHLYNIIMLGFIKSLFETPDSKKEEEKKQDNDFEMFKYDGLRAQRMNKVDYAIRCYLEALDIREDFETRGYLANAYIQSNQTDDAIVQLKLLIQSEPTHMDSYISLANLYFFQGKYEDAESICNSGIEINQEESRLYYILAKTQVELKNDIFAIGNLTKAITLDDKYMDAILSRATILLRLEQHQEAKEDIDKALSLDGEDESALLLLGRWQEAMGDIEAAKQTFTQLTDFDPFNEQAYLAMGKMLIKQKSLEEAISYLNDAIEVLPQFAAAYEERGRAKLLNGDKDGSVEDMKKALELNPKGEQDISGEFKKDGEEIKVSTGSDSTFGLFS
jgi:tetratricopeptide (TPR) repeat protein